MTITQSSFDQHCLDEVLNLTKAMLAAAESGDWKQVADMEMVRCSLLPQQLPFSEVLHETLTAILQLNIEITRLATMKLDTISALWDSSLGGRTPKNT